jgi:hypothetical protein
MGKGTRVMIREIFEGIHCIMIDTIKGYQKIKIDKGDF